MNPDPVKNAVVLERQVHGKVVARVGGLYGVDYCGEAGEAILVLALNIKRKGLGFDPAIRTVADPWPSLPSGSVFVFRVPASEVRGEHWEARIADAKGHESAIGGCGWRALANLGLHLIETGITFEVPGGEA